MGKSPKKKPRERVIPWAWLLGGLGGSIKGIGKLHLPFRPLYLFDHRPIVEF